MELFCRGRTSPADIRAAVARYPEVVDACTVTGEADALLRIRAADVRHFERIVERISAEPFVVRTRSEIVLSRLIDRPGSGPASGDAVRLDRAMRLTPEPLGFCHCVTVAATETIAPVPCQRR